MADVRLTATNPEDSSVVPVACNAKGELKLEEIPDQSFDGNLDGDLSVSGDADVTGDLDVFGNMTIENRTRPEGRSIEFKPQSKNAASGAFAEIYGQGSHETYGTDLVFRLRGNPKGTSSDIFEAVRFTYKGNVELARGDVVCSRLFATPDNGGTPGLQIAQGYNNNFVSVNILADGSASFAGNKAGFTKEGYLWCTTRRGDTVILDATSNGLASWVEYTPPSRREQIEEIRDAWSEKNAIDTTDVKFPSDPTENPADTQ